MKYALICIMVLMTGIAYAHGGLEDMQPAEMEKIQRMLVREGYLDPKDVQYGVYAYESEEAFDKWDEARIKKNMQKQLEEMKAEQAAREAALPHVTQEEPLSLWQRFVAWVKSWFS